MGGGARGEPVDVVNQQQVERAADNDINDRAAPAARTYEAADRLKRNESVGGVSDISKRPACRHVSVFVG